MRIIDVVAAAVLAVALGTPPAVAGHVCSVPLADWQPRRALAEKLEADGWTVLSIRSDDGCYKVVARNGRGETLKSKFDPASLEPIPHERHDHDGDDAD